MTVTLDAGLSPFSGGPVPRVLSLDLTRKCSLACGHCYNSSGRDGTAGVMTREDWINVLDQAAACGVEEVQFIGGEPTMHPAFAELLSYALTLGLDVEVFSNLVHVTNEWWNLFQQPGVRLATSYYSADAAAHDRVTGRASHTRTEGNIVQALAFGIPLRVGLVRVHEDQNIEAAEARLRSLGVANIRVTDTQAVGRAADDQGPGMGDLCGKCLDGRASIGPDGVLSPCSIGAWIGLGNVRETALADLLSRSEVAEVRAQIRASVAMGDPCGPDCGPNNDECTPGTPPSTCNPRN